MSEAPEVHASDPEESQNGRQFEVEEVARMFDVSKGTISRWINKGCKSLNRAPLPALRLPGRYVIFESKLRQWLTWPDKQPLPRCDQVPETES